MKCDHDVVVAGGGPVRRGSDGWRRNDRTAVRMATDARSFSAHGLAARERCHAACFSRRAWMSTFIVRDDACVDHLVQEPGHFLHATLYSSIAPTRPYESPFCGRWRRATALSCTGHAQRRLARTLALPAESSSAEWRPAGRASVLASRWRMGERMSVCLARRHLPQFQDE
jgi:hypothetical protein